MELGQTNFVNGGANCTHTIQSAPKAVSRSDVELGHKILARDFDTSAKYFQEMGPLPRTISLWDSALAHAGSIAADRPRAGREIHLLLVLARLCANRDGYCYASVRYIACICYRTLEPTLGQMRSVQYALSSLRKNGAIFELEYPGKPTHRVLCPKERIDLRRNETASPCTVEAPHANDSQQPNPCRSTAPLEQKQDIERRTSVAPPGVNVGCTPPVQLGCTPPLQLGCTQ